MRMRLELEYFSFFIYIYIYCINVYLQNKDYKYGFHHHIEPHTVMPAMESKENLYMSQSPPYYLAIAKSQSV